MRLSRLIQLINLLIGLAVVAALGTAWWLLWRPLPQTSGELSAPVAAAVTVKRDARGIPTIEAQSLDDLMFAQGFTTAQDRLWQMESLRRASSGTLSEVIGRATLEADRETRGLRMARIAERQAASLSPEDRALLEAYARGVNHYIRTQRGNYPVEFRLLGFDPRPWRVEDTLTIGLLMYRTLSTTWKTEVQKAMLLEKGDKEKIDYLFTPRGGTDVQPGSNAWAIAGSRTASGKAILASDMHVEHSLPGIWHAVHLKGAGLDVAGVTLPGVPCVIVGRNQNIAWGITNLGFDVQDVYLEQIDANTGRYLYKGQALQAELERELIPIKGEAPQEFTQWLTVHGPVNSSVGNRRGAMMWAAAVPGPFRFAVLPLNRARNWEEFRAALVDFPAASSNFVYADAAGNIGLQVMGRLPVRTKHSGDVPVEGTTGDFDWQSFIPFEELPSFYNPPSGRIVTGNQNPFPTDYKYAVNGNFAAPYRAHQIESRLLANSKWTATETVRLQADVYSEFSHRLAKRIVQAWERRKATDPNASAAVELLKSFDGLMMADQSAPLIVTYAYQNLRRMVGEKAAKQPGAVYELQMGAAHIEKLLDVRPAGWFDDWDAVLLRALQEGIEEGQRAQGTDVRKWRYGRFNQITLRQQVLERLPYIGAYFDIGPFEANGSATTIKQTSARLLPSMRLAVDFGDPSGGLFNLPAGESGHPLSGHYKDQWAAFQSAESFPLYSPAEKTLTLK